MSKQLTDFFDGFVVMKSMVGDKMSFKIRSTPEIDVYTIFDSFINIKKKKVPVKPNKFCTILDYYGVDGTLEVNFEFHRSRNLLLDKILKNIREAGYDPKVDKMSTSVFAIKVKYKDIEDFKEMFTEVFSKKVI